MTSFFCWSFFSSTSILARLVSSCRLTLAELGFRSKTTAPWLLVPTVRGLSLERKTDS